MNEKTIKDLCNEYGLGQTALARRFEIPIRTVQNWYAGVRVPPNYVVRMMDEILRNDAAQQVTSKLKTK
jgi:putative transcriptional regulator